MEKIKHFIARERANETKMFFNQHLANDLISLISLLNLQMWFQWYNPRNFHFVSFFSLFLCLPNSKNPSSNFNDSDCTSCMWFHSKMHDCMHRRNQSLKIMNDRVTNMAMLSNTAPFSADCELDSIFVFLFF